MKTTFLAGRSAARAPEKARRGPTAQRTPLHERRRAARGYFLAAAWFGLVAGGLEVVVVLLQRTFDLRVTMGSIRTNRHFVWMIPLSTLLLFGVAGLLVVGLARWRPRLAHRVAWHLYPALGALALLLRIEGLTALACVALAGGLGAVFGPMLLRRAERIGRLARVSLPPLAGVLGVVAVGWSAHLATAEGRALSRLASASPSAPNVLLIVLDNVRAESLSLEGYERPTSPHLERQARRGVRFTQARSPAPWTLAAHASMMTGRWCHQLSCGYDRALDATYPTLAETLAGHGYATAGFVGNTYYCNARYGLDRGFAHYEDFLENQAVTPFEIVRSSTLGRRVLETVGLAVTIEEGGAGDRKTAAMLNRNALRWLDGRPRAQPFFLFLNYFDAHAPYIPPDGPDPRFGLAALSREQQTERLLRMQRLGQGKPLPGDPPPEQVLRESTQIFRDTYESCIAYLDRQIGQLLDDLDRRGLRENTLIIVTSDHGEQFNEHGFRGHGLSVYNREVHVPLLIFPPAPKAAAGTVVNEPVSLRDLPATVADLLGLGTRAPFPGRSLARFWKPAGQTDVPVADPVFSEVEHQTRFPRDPGIPATLGPMRAVVVGEHVLIRHSDRREEVFHLPTDPLETRNLVAEPALQPTVNRLRAAYEQILQDEGPAGPLP